MGIRARNTTWGPVYTYNMGTSLHIQIGGYNVEIRGSFLLPVIAGVTGETLARLGLLDWESDTTVPRTQYGNHVCMHTCPVHGIFCFATICCSSSTMCSPPSCFCIMYFRVSPVSPVKGMHARATITTWGSGLQLQHGDQGYNYNMGIRATITLCKIPRRSMDIIKTGFNH
jgi:hypothetical protein